MRIGVTSENKLKNEVVKEVFGLGADIKGYATYSGVGEQPVGEETLVRARNRIADLRGRESGLDKIVSIENGIFFEKGKWVDVVVVLVLDVAKNREMIAYSEGVVFPTKYVEMAKKIGFDKMTVGKVMADEGFVTDAKDPHKSISGKSRKDYLLDTLASLVKK